MAIKYECGDFLQFQASIEQCSLLILQLIIEAATKLNLKIEWNYLIKNVYMSLGC